MIKLKDVIKGKKMIKLKDIIKEDVGGPGKASYPANHKAGMQVAKGGSMCANCLYWQEKGNQCNSSYWIKWAQSESIPVAADEYCCNWWEPNKE